MCEDLEKPMALDGQEVDVVTSQAKLLLILLWVKRERRSIQKSRLAWTSCQVHGGPRLRVEEFHAWAGGTDLGQDTVNPPKDMQVTGP